MVTVQLYQPGAVNFTFPFADNWNELTTAQLQVVSHVFHQLKEDGEAKAALLYGLLDMHRKKLPPNTIKKIDIDDLATVGQDLVSFIWEDNLLSKQPYPVIRLGWFKKMIGPESDFDNITCGEYELAEICVHQFYQDKDIKHLAELAAILYRPKNVPLFLYNLKRNEYIQYPYEKQTASFLLLPVEVLFTIYLWYCGCRNWLTKFFPNVYGSGEGGQPDMQAFTKCIHAAAGEKNGTRQQVRLLKLKEILFEMEQEMIKAKEIEKKYGAQQP